MGKHAVHDFCTSPIFTKFVCHKLLTAMKNITINRDYTISAVDDITKYHATKAVLS